MAISGEGDLPPLSDPTEQSYGFVNDFDDYKPSRFRFKSKRSRDVKSDLEEHQTHHERKGRHRGHHHRHMRQRSSHGQDTGAASTPADGTQGMDSEAAFRESLFDAMADDEGAAYWEGVYGQPIHVYSKQKPSDPSDPDGGLEEMSDEEYAAHVRARMWEKTHQHVIEERKLREEAARRRKEAQGRTEQMESEKAAFDRKMEESLRRGQERKQERAWRDAWAIYMRGWEKLSEQTKGRTGDEDRGPEDVASRIPWPVRSGRQADVDNAAVEDFLHHAAARRGTETGLRTVLKAERVRWHPDRMSHRLGGNVASNTLQSVTAVFQIIDSMYNRTRSSAQ